MFSVVALTGRVTPLDANCKSVLAIESNMNFLTQFPEFSTARCPAIALSHLDSMIGV
jgi:hypothetical protein